MTSKSYLWTTNREEDKKKKKQHGGSGGKFDDNRTFLQKWAHSFFKKNGITAEDRSKVTLRNSPYVKAKEFANVVSDKVDDVKDSITSQSVKSAQTGSSAKPIVYSDWSPAAQQFGMDQSTAYAEHMANTAHQREVADLRAAGLNPVLGVGSGASGVSGHIATSGSSAQKSLNGDGIVDAIGATAAVVTALLTKNPAYGYLAGNAVNSVGDMFTKRK